MRNGSMLVRASAHECVQQLLEMEPVVLLIGQRGLAGATRLLLLLLLRLFLSFGSTATLKQHLHITVLTRARTRLAHHLYHPIAAAGAVQRTRKPPAISCERRQCLWR